MMKWKTRDGTKIDVREMTDMHLRATYKMVVRCEPVYFEHESACMWVALFSMDSDSMAWYYADLDVVAFIERGESEFGCRWTDTFRKEGQRRGLDVDEWLMTETPVFRSRKLRAMQDVEKACSSVPF